MVDIEKQLLLSRKKLLDLTLRNRLLNFRSTKAQSLKITHTTPDIVFKTLVTDEKQMRFRAIERNTNGNADNQSTSTDYLWSELPDDELYERLNFIMRKSNIFLEEQGYSILYLALGFLKWRESVDGSDNLAPLILIPVNIERLKTWLQFKVKWNENDITTNVSLKAKLTEQGLSLPEIEKTDIDHGIGAYYDSVAQAVCQKNGWKVVPDIYLGFFSFTKFVMYNDLDPGTWPSTNSPIDHPILNAMYNPEKYSINISDYSDSEIDEITTDRSVFHVMDADPSQIKVIEDVKNRKSIVVEGPPGTGKSQTIVNMIAGLLAMNRKVLFVSEKMAALEVVKERLDNIGLGDYCLQLHDHKTTKKTLIAELKRCLSKTPPQSADSVSEFEQLVYLKNYLNLYASVLHSPVGNMKLTPFQLFCRKEAILTHFTDRVMQRIPIMAPESIDTPRFTSSVEAIRELDPYLDYIGKAGDHPWFGSNPGVVLPQDQEEISALVSRCIKSLEGLRKALDEFVSVTGISMPMNEETTKNAIEASLIIANGKIEYTDILLNSEWNGPNAKAESIISRIESYRHLKNSLQEKMHETAFQLDSQTLLKDYSQISSNFWKYIRPNYHRMKKTILIHYRSKPSNDKSIINDLTMLSECNGRKNDIRSMEEAGKLLFGAIWIAEESDPVAMKNLSVWIVLFRKKLMEGVFTDGTINRMINNFSSKQSLESSRSLSAALDEFVQLKDALFNRIRINTGLVFEVKDNQIPFDQIQCKFDLWADNIGKIQRWSQYVAKLERCSKTDASPMIVQIVSGDIKSGDLLPCFEGNLYDGLIRLAYNQWPIIAEFNGNVHEGKINRFAELDKAIIISNRNRLSGALYSRVPHVLIGMPHVSQESILQKEIYRQRGHMPIRQLLKRAGGIIQRIKPCFMMSPHSIAQFLDHESISFDVVIFDEASQVRPEEALGAILRGQQVVVIGDSRQLPPTSFFDHMTESDNGEEDFDVDEINASSSDMESILNQCKRVFPPRTLEWHYRSRHESLIAVSNREFYDNAMLIYPSSVDFSEDLGLQFVYLPDTIYDRGKSSRNIGEAKAVVDAVFDHFRRHPEKSLGVGTFNTKQQKAIEDEIDLRLRTSQEMTEFFDKNRYEHFFVKNLETIQGDERDVIFLSMGFGFDEDGRMSLNFGPLNQEGGERRLNVLITRAREKCIVFSNFKASDLQLKSDSPFGVRALKAFLEYAETRMFPRSTTSSEDSDSPFEESVYNFLRDNGYEVRKQVGCARFFIDLAIIDPKSPGKYMLGIECDGAQYHSCVVARERDRLRQQILENLGWKIHRVWSTDWYHNRGETQEKLLKAIKLVKY